MTPDVSFPPPQPYRSFDREAMIARARRAKAPGRAFRPIELGAAVAIAAAIDIGAWHDGLDAGGFGQALVFAFLPLAVAAASRTRVISPRLIVLAGLAAAVAVRSLYSPTPGTFLAGIALTGGIALALRRRTLSVPDVFLSIFAGFGKLPARLGAAGRGVMNLVAKTRVGRVNLVPVLVPIALVLAFLLVFALANPVVGDGLTRAWLFVREVIALPSIGRIVLFTTSLALATVLLRPGVWFSRGAEVVRTAPGTAAPEASFTAIHTARNALFALNGLFFLFLGLDAKFLIIGSAPAGMTTQAYAHQGAFWLTVALLMVTAVIGVMFRGALAHDANALVPRKLAYVWMGQGLVLALATYRRIAIHIAHSGLSNLRIVGILGTTLVVSGVVLVALKLRDQRTFMWLVRRQLDAFAITAIVYCVGPTHAISAHVNVSRAMSGEYRPLLHAFAQSRHAESADALLPLLNHSDARVRQGVAALLIDEKTQLEDQLDRETSWRGRDLASRHALAKLEAADLAGALGAANRERAKDVLLEISRVANEDRSLEEILSVPSATDSRNMVQ